MLVEIAQFFDSIRQAMGIDPHTIKFFAALASFAAGTLIAFNPDLWKWWR